MGADGLNQLEAIHMREMQVRHKGADIILNQPAQSFCLRQIKLRSLMRIAPVQSSIFNPPALCLALDEIKINVVVLI